MNWVLLFDTVADTVSVPTMEPGCGVLKPPRGGPPTQHLARWLHNAHREVHRAQH
jgi:hypothetical protein